jgi:hypothetical protein
MAIKNYTSDIPTDRIFAELQKALGSHGAKQISYDYGDDGKMHGVQFVIKVKTVLSRSNCQHELKKRRRF